MAATLGPLVVGVCESPTVLVRLPARRERDPAPAVSMPDWFEVDYLGLSTTCWLRGLRVNGNRPAARVLGRPGRVKRTE